MIRGGIVFLNVSDVARAVRFYIETLGMKLVAESEGSSVLDAGDGFLVGLRSGEIARASATELAFTTKVPIDEAIAIYENRGVTFTTERTGGAVVARFRDPDGNALSLRQNLLR
jgi:catechol 2,3-dioxygenase-like lactoylglutathione lyase family enzyme